MKGTKGSRSCVAVSLLLFVVAWGGSGSLRMPALSTDLPRSVQAQTSTDYDGDGDGVATGDNCVLNANGHQEDSDGNGTGDVCDPYTINPVFEAASLPAAGSFHAATPFYRALVNREGVRFSPEDGLGSARPASIGLPGGDDTRVSTLTFAGATGLSDTFPSTVGPGPLQQSTWQSLVATITPTTPEIGGHPIRQHHGSGGNAIALGYEIELARVETTEVGTADVRISHTLTLPLGWSLDTGELGAGEGVGRLTIRDEGGVPRARISAVDIAALGSPTVLQNSDSFFGLTRLSDELKTGPVEASAGPPDLVGSNFSDGIEAPLVQTAYFLDENMPDTAHGLTEVQPLILDGPPAFRVTMVAPAAVIERNRGTSALMLIGMRISSLTPVNLGAGTTIYGRHAVGFDEEATVIGENVTIKLQNTLGTFSGLPTDYSLLPNGGGTAARQNAAEQQQTMWSCNGCTMALTGNSTIQFVEGGAGVGISAGSRVGPAHSCLATNPIDHATNTGRCEAGKFIRGSFVADRLTVQGSMSGLTASESDVALQELTFVQGRDPNVTDPMLLHGVIGAGCSADAGVRIGRNPSNGQTTGNVPVALVGGLLTPLATPPTTGICNFTARRVELLGLAAADNPDPDLTVPSGDGLALHMRAGRGDIGPRRFNPGTATCELQGGDGKPSRIDGFQVAMSLSGGANVVETTGEPLAAGDPRAVPPNVYCLDKIRANDNETGLIVNGNVHVIASRLQIEGTQFGAVQLGGSTANVATSASGCPTTPDGACQTPVVELACPTCRQGHPNFLAVASLGLTAPTKLTLIQSVIGIGAQGVASGQNPVLPPLVLNADLTPPPGGLRIGRRAASLFRTPILVTRGADTAVNPTLVSLALEASNIGVNGAAITIENRDGKGISNISLPDSCYTPDAANCITHGVPVLAASEADGTVKALNTAALKQATNTLNLAGIALDCTAIVPDPDPVNPLDIDTALKALCDATLGVAVGGASRGFARAADQAFLLGKTGDAAIKIDEGAIVGACGKIDAYDDKLSSLATSGPNARISAAAKASLEAASDVVIARMFDVARAAGVEAQCRAALRDRP